MLKSIRSLLSTEIIKRNVKSLPKGNVKSLPNTGFTLSVCSTFNTTGNTTSALVQLRETNVLQALVDFIKYVLKTIEPVKDDILNYRDDMADERGY